MRRMVDRSKCARSLPGGDIAGLRVGHLAQRRFVVVRQRRRLHEQQRTGQAECEAERVRKPAAEKRHMYVRSIQACLQAGSAPFKAAQAQPRASRSAVATRSNRSSSRAT